MRIGTNIPAMQAQNQLRKTQAALGRALERLASGKRINSGKDDASGLARANGLEAQTRGLARTIQNINDSMSVLQTADSAVSTQMEILQRIREIAVQAANGTINTTDRSSLNIEVQSLFDEYQRITRQTDFNGLKLLDGSFSTKSIQVGMRKGDSVDASIGTTQASQIVQKKAGIGTFTTSTTYTMGTSAGQNRIADFDGDGYNDIATLDTSADQLNIRYGSSDGSFNTRKTFAVGSTAVSFEVGDLNNDGEADFVTNNGTANTITVNLNQGGRSFSSQNYSTQANVKGITIGDFDGDGNKDIASYDWTSGTTSYISTFMGRGGGAFASRVTTSISNSNASLGTVYFNDVIQSGDVSGDGRADIVVGYKHSGSFKGIVNAYSVSSSASLNLLSSNLVWQGAGTQIDMGFTGLNLGDLNNDGKLDIYVATNEFFNTGMPTAASFAYRLMGQGSGIFTTTGIGEPTNPANGIVSQNIADINGDGLLDRLTSYYDLTLEDNLTGIQIGNGDGTFSATSTRIGAGGDQGYAPAVGDLNNDGINDILISNVVAASATIYSQGTQWTSALGDVTVATQTNAKSLISIMDTAIGNLNSIRSNLGAEQNRLESSANVNMLTKENLEAAKSNLMDADIAEETANLVRSQILQQAQVSVLGQANLQLQLVLGLLRF